MLSSIALFCDIPRGREREREIKRDGGWEEEEREMDRRVQWSKLVCRVHIPWVNRRV